MRELGISILSSAAVSGMLTAALIWLSKTWITERLKNDIKYEYEKELATHKDKLKVMSDASLERLRTELQDTTARRAEITLETRKVIHDGIAKLASATHSMCWLTWFAQESPNRISEERVSAYDQEMHVLLPDIISFQSLLSTYSIDVGKSFGLIIADIEDLDARIGSAAVRLLDGDSKSIGKLQKYHEEADELHNRLQKLCSKTSMITQIKEA
jgi:hypothetical protein